MGVWILLWSISIGLPKLIGVTILSDWLINNDLGFEAKNEQICLGCEFELPSSLINAFLRPNYEKWAFPYF